MRILVVAMANSVHTIRWLEQFDDNKDMQILVFPSTVSRISFSKKWKKLPLLLVRLFKTKRAVFCYFPVSKVNTAIRLLFQNFLKDKFRTNTLVKTIQKYKPDIIHSLEFQSAGYFCLEARKTMGDNFPTWIATNWGSDIYLFKNIKDHHTKIKEILSLADFYSAECQRDYILANEIGMKAKPLPVIPNAGGLHLDKIEPLRSLKKTSQRNLIMVKGYQMTFGRALTTLKAIETISEELKRKETEIFIFSVTPDIELAVELFIARTGIKTKIVKIENKISHNEMLEFYAQARCYVGISISDGISTSMLEAMALGAFPIQTCTSCANEWLTDKSGYIVPVEDPILLGQKILEAMTDDDLVDQASETNWKTILEKASYSNVKLIANKFYSAETVKSRKLN